MNISYKVNDACTVNVEIGGVKQAFQMLAHLSEVFGVKACGNCKSPNVKPRFRTARRKDNNAECEYYDYQCQDCKYEYKFGQKQQPGAPLFPKGWEPGYQGGDNSSEQPQYGTEPVYQYGPEGYQQPAPPMRQPAPQQYQAPAQQAAGSIPF